MFLDIGIECCFKIQTFTSLMIDGHSLHFSIPFVGAFFIGHDDIFIVVEICYYRQCECDDSADRNVPVIISFFVHFEEEWVHFSGYEKPWCSYDSIYLFVERIVFAKCACIERDSCLFYQFYTHETVLSSA